jgi:hypothetical protein
VVDSDRGGGGGVRTADDDETISNSKKTDCSKTFLFILMIGWKFILVYWLCDACYPFVFVKYEVFYFVFVRAMVRGVSLSFSS